MMDRDRIQWWLVLAFVVPTAARAEHPLGQARAALLNNDPDAARKALAGYQGPLSDVAALYLAATQPRALALATLAKIPRRAPACGLDDPLAAQADTLAATLLADQPAQAAPIWERLAPSPQTLGQAHRAYVAAGLKNEALRIARQMAIHFPTATETEATGFDPATLSLDDKLERIRNLLDSHENSAAVAEATALLSAPGAPRCELDYVIGKGERKQRRYAPALTALVRARQGCPHEPEGFGIKAALLEAQVRAIRGQRRALRALAEWFVKKHPGHAYVDDVWFLLGEVEEKAGVGDAAYREVELRFPNSDHASLAVWRLALGAMEQGASEEAEKRLRWLLEHKATRPVDHARARYWLAQLLESKQPEASGELYRALVQVPSFYAWLALDRLRRLQPAFAQQLEAQLLTARAAPTEPRDLPFAREQELFQIDPALATAEVLRQSCDASDLVVIDLAEVLHRGGAYPQAQLLLRARPHLLAQFGPQNLHIWRLAYSQAYWPEIQKAAAAERLEPLLLLALVREESTFDPQIVSWAGATGLAQLMPATAVGAYADVFGGKLDLTRLTDPELNLRLGARVLHDGLRGFGRQTPLALGAYNGGAGLVKRFLGPKQPFDRWIERFGVKETRRYMRRVTETWGIYRLLYDPAPFVPLPAEIGS